MDSSAKPISNVRFEKIPTSPYVKGSILEYTKNGVRRKLEFASSHSSVAVLLYHLEFKKFLVVRQFRPAVFVGFICREPDNGGKQLNDVDWTKYDTEIGYTLELCAGIIDKELPIKDIAREEVLEECGYAITVDDLRSVTTYMTNSATHTVYYAEINEKMKISEGGGNVFEGEEIMKVFMSEDEAKSFLQKPFEGRSPFGFWIAFHWWFYERTNSLPGSTDSFVVWDPPSSARMTDLQITPNPNPAKFDIWRMQFQVNSYTRHWDLCPGPCLVSLLLHDVASNTVVVQQTFVPDAFVNRALHLAWLNNKPDPVDFTIIDQSNAFTLELFMEKNISGEKHETTGKRLMKRLLGTDQLNMELIKNACVGIGVTGSTQSIYYVQLSDANLKWATDEMHSDEIKAVHLPVHSLRSLLQQDIRLFPASFIFALKWFLHTKT